MTILKYLKEAIATYTSRAAEKLRRHKLAAGVVQVFASNGDRERSRKVMEAIDPINRRLGSVKFWALLNAGMNCWLRTVRSKVLNQQFIPQISNAKFWYAVARLKQIWLMKAANLDYENFGKR